MILLILPSRLFQLEKAQEQEKLLEASAKELAERHKKEQELLKRLQEKDVSYPLICAVGGILKTWNFQLCGKLSIR